MRISELMEYLEPEDNKTVDKENLISPEKVEQLVMKKIQEEQSLKRELMRKKRFARVFASAAALAAVLLIGVSGYAKANSLSISDLFKRLIYGEDVKENYEQLDKMETRDFSQSNCNEQSNVELQSGAEDTLKEVDINGLVVTPLEAFSDGYELYLQFAITTPEEVILPELQEGQCYQLDSGEDFDLFPGYDEGYEEADLEIDGKLANNQEIIRQDNHTLIWTKRYFLSHCISDKFGLPSIYHFSGIWIQERDNSYTEIITGDYNIPLDGLQVPNPLTYKIDTSHGGGTMKVTNLSAYWFDNADCSGNRWNLKVVLSDGSEISYQWKNGVWEKSIDLDKVEKVILDGIELEVDDR